MARPDLIKEYDAVFYVEADPSEPANPVAIRPRFFKDHAEWEDTSKGKVCYLEKIETDLTDKRPDKIELINQNGKRITLHFLTLDIYNENVKNYVFGSPSYNSTEELQNFYLTESFVF